MLHERSEAAEASGDRLTGLGMFSNFARQRQQFQRELKLDIARGGALRDACALRLLAFLIVLLLAELDVGAEAAGLDPDIATRVGVLAERTVGGRLAVGGELTGV